MAKRGFPDQCPEVSNSFDTLNAASYQVFGERVDRDAQGQATLVHVPLGTAWAVGDRLLATNAHITEVFPQSASAGVQLTRAIAVQSGTGTVIRLARGFTHPDYDPAALTPDVGLFESEQALPTILPLAPADSVLGLGDEVQIVGFPGDVDMILTVVPGETVPQATSLTGRITARRAFDDTAAVTPDTLAIYQHQAPTSPGSSGSSMFHCGLVAGINNAGTVRLVLTPDSTGTSITVDRQPAASNNFGIHVRYIHEMVNRFAQGTLDGLELPVVATSVPVGGVPVASGPPVGVSGARVDIVDFAFSPDVTSISPGGTVVWNNTGQGPHTVTADDGSFESGQIQSGGSAQATFATAGAFGYHCAIHPQMQGTITVQANGTPGAEPLPVAGQYMAAVTAPTARHSFTFTIGENGIIQGTSTWEQTGEFGLAGQVNPDGTFQMTDDAPERRGFRRGIYQGTVAPDGSIAGAYFEQTQEESQWPFVGGRGE